MPVFITFDIEQVDVVTFEQVDESSIAYDLLQPTLETSIQQE